MKKILFIILPLIVLSCRNDLQVERLQSKLNFETEFIQQFKIAPDSIVEVIGEKGTKIIFNSNDLEGTLLNGPNIKDSLYVNLIELTTKQDLLLANTQTVSNGKWLISGGAFKIDITANGESLTLKDGKTIKVELPKTTADTDMQLFYGERGLNNNMNWTLSNTNLQEKKFYSIYFKDTTVLDYELTRRNDVDMYDLILLADTLGYITISELKSRYSKIDTIITKKNILKAYENFRNIDELSKVNNRLYNYYSKINMIYESVEINNLGWINVDKFVVDDDKVTVNLNFNKKVDALQTFIIDETNNTILNVYSNLIEVPVKRRFYIISFGLKGDTMYAFKKLVRFSESKIFNIELSEVSDNELKSILTLE